MDGLLPSSFLQNAGETPNNLQLSEERKMAQHSRKQQIDIVGIWSAPQSFARHTEVKIEMADLFLTSCPPSYTESRTESL